MKKTITLLSLLIVSVGTIFSQTQNGSFEVWENRSFTFDPAAIDPALGGFLQPETYNYSSPDGWSTVNQISRYSLLGGQDIARKDSSANVVDGSYAIRLTTTTVTLPIINQPFTIPAFVVSGEFQVDPTLLVGAIGGGGGGGIDITSFPGAGQPINYRPQSIEGYYNYAPSGSDSLWAISALVKRFPNGDREIVGLAEIRSSQATSSMTFFSIDYEYFNCATPDTVITFFSSSYIDADAQFTGNGGSRLFVDSVALSGVAPLLPPVLADDQATIFINEVATIAVLDNDRFCDGDDTTPSVVTGVSNGTLTLNSNNEYVYTPDTDFTGTDQFTYEICNGQGCDQATVTITVTPYPDCIVNLISRIVNGTATDVFASNTVDCDLSTLEIVTPASNGTAAVTGTQLSYTANAGFLGSDQFTYKACSPFIATQCDEADVFITVLTNINTIDAAYISVFPNPARDVLFVEFNLQQDATLKLFDLKGQMVHTSNFVNQTSVSLNNFSNGLYILKIETAEGTATQKVKIVK